MDAYKVVVMGSGGVGKSAITLQFVQGHFLSNYDPTIEDTYKKRVTVKGTEIGLDILDTAGQDDFSQFHTTWIRGGHGFIVVFSVDSMDSFYEAEKFVHKIRTTTDRDDLPINICGNKCDLPNRLVTKVAAESTCEELNVQYFETCAVTNMNITEAFMDLAARICAQHPAVNPNRETPLLAQGTDTRQNEGGCGGCCQVQ